jgi:dethiobiotin synthetase
VVVARRGLGTLNHTLLTLEAARLRGIRLAGVVLNGAGPTREEEALAETTNAGELARRVDGVAVLAEVPHGEDPELALMDALLGRIGWAGRALLPRDRPTAPHDPGVADAILRVLPDAPGASSEEIAQR